MLSEDSLYQDRSQTEEDPSEQVKKRSGKSEKYMDEMRER